MLIVSEFQWWSEGLLHGGWSKLGVGLVLLEGLGCWSHGEEGEDEFCEQAFGGVVVEAMGDGCGLAGFGPARGDEGDAVGRVGEEGEGVVHGLGWVTALAAASDSSWET